jgi:HAD superfamily hydrolase (TIGR01509 family)
MRGLIFDFDGTIVDTEWPEVEAWRAIYGEFGFDFPDEAWKATIGRGADQETERPAQALARLLHQPGRAYEFAARHRAERIRRIRSEPIRPGILSLLAEAESQGLRLGVASSSDHEWVEGHLDRLGLKQRFETFCCREDVAQTKPDPALYQLALDRLKLKPEEAVAIEDSPSGLASAQAAGIYTVVSPNRLTAQLDLSPADWLLDSFEQASLEEIRLRLAARPKGNPAA